MAKTTPQTTHKPTAAQWVAFWPWFWSTGIRSFVRDRKEVGILVLHLVIGGFLAFSLTAKLSEIAITVLAPFGSILFGLTFAWSGTFAGLIQTETMRRIGKAGGGDIFRQWVMNYQMTLLVVLAVTVLWSLTGMGAFTLPANHVPWWVRMVGRALMFTLASIAVRESWGGAATIHTILLHSELLQREIEDHTKKTGTPPTAHTPTQQIEPTLVRAAPETATPGENTANLPGAGALGSPQARGSR